MASAPRRRDSKEEPPDMSELMKNLIEYAASFIKQFDINEPNLRCIVEELRRITEELQVEQQKKDRQRNLGAAVTGLGLVATVLSGGIPAAGAVMAAPFSRGLSLAVSLPVTAAVAAAGAGAVIHANASKIRLEEKSAKEVENLGKIFQQIVEPMKTILEEIQETCEKLEQKSVELQAENTLRDMKEFEDVLKRVSDLKEMSQGAVDVAVIMIQLIGDMLVYIREVVRIFPTPEEDRRLRESIRQTADQSQRVVDEFDQMRKELRSVTET